VRLTSRPTPSPRQALERVPSDIRRDGGVARMSDPKMIQEIMSAVSIPVMAKSRIGHLVEAQILQHIGVDYIDEQVAPHFPLLRVFFSGLTRVVCMGWWFQVGGAHAGGPEHAR